MLRYLKRGLSVTEEDGRPMDDVTWLLHRHAQVRLPFMDDAPIHCTYFCVPAVPSNQPSRLFYNNIYRWVNLEPSCWHGSMISFSWTIPRSSKLDQVRVMFRWAKGDSAGERPIPKSFQNEKEPYVQHNRDADNGRDLTICSLVFSNRAGSTKV